MLLDALWRQGVLATLIANELGKPYDGVLQMARRRGLKPKIVKGVRNEEKVMTLRLDAELFYGIMKEARRRRISVATYTRKILAADVAKSKPSGEVAESGRSHSVANREIPRDPRVQIPASPPKNADLAQG